MTLKIALGSERSAKIEALRHAVARIAILNNVWQNAQIIACNVSITAPAMPLTDEELMHGARERALATQQQLLDVNQSAQFYVGLEGGFHSISLDGKKHTFLRGWAFVTDGARENYGASPSISVPDLIVRRVIDDQTELGLVIDKIAGEHDVRSRQGAWGMLSNDLLTRAMSFEQSLIAAFAPFYNPKFYS